MRHYRSLISRYAARFTNLLSSLRAPSFLLVFLPCRAILLELQVFRNFITVARPPPSAPPSLSPTFIIILPLRVLLIQVSRFSSKLRCRNLGVYTCIYIWKTHVVPPRNTFNIIRMSFSFSLSLSLSLSPMPETRHLFCARARGRVILRKHTNARAYGRKTESGKVRYRASHGEGTPEAGGLLAQPPC